jgi:crotonobetainyl-CoA:carnitine CoA-transferase CaiB-like acyl-CoA transferase
VRLLRFPLELSSGRATIRRPPPMPGEHTEEILRQYGYADDAIRRLRDASVV